MTWGQTMATREITNYDPVVTPAVGDEFLCQQVGVTKKITSTQILDNITNLDAASTLDGTEELVIMQSGDNYKITSLTLAQYIMDNV